jgi:hypothetical protein
MSQGHQGRQRVWNRSLLAGGGRWAQRTSATISRSWGWWERLVRSARSAWRRSGRLARWPASRWLRSARRMIAQARWWAGGRDSRRTARRPRWRPRWRTAPRGGPTGTARPLTVGGEGARIERSKHRAQGRGGRPARRLAVAIARWRTASGLRAGMPRPWRVKALRSDSQVVPRWVAALTLPSRSANAKARSASPRSARNRLGCQPSGWRSCPRPSSAPHWAMSGCGRSRRRAVRRHRADPAAAGSLSLDGAPQHGAWAG